jgi:hypothetical protein
MRPFIALLLMAMLLMPLAAHPGTTPSAEAQVNPPELSQAITQLDGYIERESRGGSGNDSPQAAEPIGPTLSQPGIVSWSQTVSGTISASSDLDYYRFTITRPASQVRISLSGLPADYDLVFGGGVELQNGEFVPFGDFDAGSSGLEGITQVGSTINAIGSTINAIGSTINAIGSTINAIGSTINAIGSTINAISANSGTTPEQVDTFVWQPGVYFVAVAPSNGQFSANPYRLEVTLEGSVLAPPPPAPRVNVRPFIPGSFLPEEVTTLYLHHPARLEQLYPQGVNQISAITNALNELIISPPQPSSGRAPEYGILLDLSTLEQTPGNTRTITDVYDLWDNNAGNPLYANYIARTIDNIIKAAISGEDDPSADFVLGFEESPIAFPNVRNIVLVGGDEVFPFFRLPDLTTIANEAEYLDYTRAVAGGDMLDPAKPLGAALRYRMLLSDNPYGTDRPYRFYGAPLFLPTLAVGRLVETPAEIAAYLNEYAFASEGNLLLDVSHFGQPDGPTRAFVSGYDFLQDQAEAISDIFEQTGLFSNEYNALINDDWQRKDLEDAWFDQRLETELPLPLSFITPGNQQIGLSSVNAHFDHWQLLPAQNPLGTPAGNFPARRLLDPQYEDEPSVGLYFSRTLGYSVGCHSGYNVPLTALSTRSGLDRATYAPDFAQALLRHGGSWIGNTGYGYGTADGIDYSERLAVLLTQEFARSIIGSDDIPVYPGIGEALMLAKQRYVRNATSLSEYDYKALSVMSLYGLPYIGVFVSNPLEPPTEDPQPGGGAPLETEAPREASSTTARLTRTITFTIDIDAESFTGSGRTGQQVQLSPGLFTVEDSFVDEGFPAQLPRIFENNQAGAPTLPTFAYDISALNNSSSQRLKVRDVVFVGGTYAELPGFNPQITQVVTETSTPIISTTLEPEFTAGAGIWFPDKFYGYSTVGEDELQRDQLTSFAAQFRADADGRIGTLRPYRTMIFRVTYDDPAISLGPAATALLRDDDRPPVIESVEVRDSVGGAGLVGSEPPAAVLVVTARDEDAQGNPQPPAGLTVSALFIQDDVNWIELPLTLNPTTGVFTANLPATTATDARYIVRATDPAGNTTYFTAGGRFTVYSPTALYLPLVRR